MTDLTDEIIVTRLKKLVAENGIKLTEIAEATGIPYRTLQNQMNGTSRISALNLLKILDATGIPSSFLTTESAAINLACLALSLETVLGENLPRVDHDELGEFVVDQPKGRTRKQLREDAFNLAYELDREYGVISVHMTDAFAKSPGDPNHPIRAGS